MCQIPEFLSNPDPEIYLSDNYLVLDFEIDTSHGDYGAPIHPDNQMLLAVWKHSIGSMRVKWGDEYQLEDVLEAITSVDFIVAHNAKYELGWLKRCGLELHDVLVFDTKIAEYVLLGNLAAGDKTIKGKSTSLDLCCKRRGYPAKDPAINTMMTHGINPVEMPPSWLQGRCERDVRETEKLFLDQREHLVNTKRLSVVYTRCLLTPVLADIEFNGMHLDQQRVEEEFESHTRELYELRGAAEQQAEGVNWNSPKQIAEYIYDTLGFPEFKNRDGSVKLTPTGRRMTGKAWIEKLKPTTPEQRAFLKIKKRIGKVQAALNKNLEFFQGACKETHGTFYAGFNQTVTATHRLSSSGIPTKYKMFDKSKSVQFQNLPNAFKRLFCSRHVGWKMAEADGSQLEFRVAGFIGNDKQIIEDIDNHHDVHTFTASIINNCSQEDVTKVQRKKAKAHTFKPLYGGQSGTKREKAYYKAFKERYSGLAQTQKGWISTVLKDKKLITPWGMRYYWPRIRRSRTGYVNVTSNVYNYPVQALATAEIIPIAVTYMWHRIREAGLEDSILMVNTIHDSVICEIEENKSNEFRKISLQAFGNDVYSYLKEVYSIDFNVTLGCGIMIAGHWADDSEGEEESYDIRVDKGTIEQI